MSTTLTRNLKLRVNSGLTADSKYNLERLDTLGGVFLPDSTDTLVIRSPGDIRLETNSSDLGSSGSGGSIYLGLPGQSVDLISLQGLEINVPVALGLLDQGTAGTRYLRLRYDSTLVGPVDLVTDRELTIDLGGADRVLALTGSLVLTGDADLEIVLTGPTTVTLPTTGTLATVAQVDALIPDQSGHGGEFLTTNGLGTLSWGTPGGGSGGAVNSYTTTWLSTAGTSLVVAHTLLTRSVQVTLLDDATDQVIGVDQIVVTDTSHITLTASEAPGTSWTVIIHG